MLSCQAVPNACLESESSRRLTLWSRFGVFKAILFAAGLGLPALRKADRLSSRN